MSIHLSSGEKIGLIGNLATLLAAGIPILEAVDSVLEDTTGNQKKVLETLKADLMQGKHLYSSFSRFPRVFDKVTINLIRASEEAGNLETVLKDLQDHMQKEIEFSDRVKFAMIYPLFIGIVFAGVLFMILVVVVPKIASVFARLRVELPLPTRILIFTSDLLLKHTVLFLAGLAVLIGLFVLIYVSNKRLLKNIFLNLPLVSSLSKAVDLARFSRSMHLLLSSGLPIVSALELAQDVVERSQMVRLITRSREMVAAGRKLSDGLRTDKSEVPVMVIKLIEAGEKSGTLDKSMQEISTHLDYKVSNDLKTLTAVMEPVLLVFVGVSVGVMMMSIIAPIYGLIGQVNTR